MTPVQKGEKVTLDVKPQRDELSVILAGLIEKEEPLAEETGLSANTPIRVDWKGGMTASEMIIEERGEV